MSFNTLIFMSPALKQHCFIFIFENVVKYLLVRFCTCIKPSVVVTVDGWAQDVNAVSLSLPWVWGGGGTVSSDATGAGRRT